MIGMGKKRFMFSCFCVSASCREIFLPHTILYPKRPWQPRLAKGTGMVSIIFAVFGVSVRDIGSDQRKNILDFALISSPALFVVLTP